MTGRFPQRYVSLLHLYRLPLTEVKLDRSYAGKIVHTRPDRAIVKMTHDLAPALGVRVVADGREGEAMNRVLAALDSVGQGCYHGRPMCAGELVGWLHRRQDHAR